jgi:ribosomal protein S18 acetylase RimI-like enzyme
MHSDESPAPLEVRPVAPRDRFDVYAWLGGDEATLPIGLEQGLFEATSSGRRVGAIWASLLPGRVASIVGPQVEGNEQAAAGQALITAANRFVAARGVRVAQALVDANDDARQQWFSTAKYEHEILIDYLACRLDELPTPTVDRHPLEFVTYGVERHDRLAAVLQSTFQDSQDCPVLHRVRHHEDLLAGYRAVGRFAPQRWFILRARSRDVGCLLLTDHPADEQWEIVYLGIAAAARGVGFGTEATKFAQQQAASAGRRRLILAVDAGNVPAQAVYRKTGFVAWDRKRALLRIF